MYQSTVVPRSEEEGDIPKGAVAHSLLERNSNNVQLTVRPTVDRVRYVQDSERDALFSGRTNQIGEGWAAFYKVFPLAMGLINVSLPGYDERACASLIYLERQHGTLAAEGVFVWLKWRDGKWVVVKRRTQWAS